MFEARGKLPDHPQPCGEPVSHAPISTSLDMSTMNAPQRCSKKLTTQEEQHIMAKHNTSQRLMAIRHLIQNSEQYRIESQGTEASVKSSVNVANTQGQHGRNDRAEVSVAFECLHVLEERAETETRNNVMLAS